MSFLPLAFSSSFSLFFSPLHRDGVAVVCVGAGFVITLAVSSVLAAFYGVLLVLSLVNRGGAEAMEAVFLALQCVAHLAAATIVAHEKRFRAATHPLTLRLYWLAAPALTALLASTSVARLASGAARLPDDTLAIAALVLSLPLPLLSILGSTGVVAVVVVNAVVMPSMPHVPAARPRPYAAAVAA
jgi:ATP-binding cassette subfamily C (CFTR/MRP) protein 1